MSNCELIFFTISKLSFYLNFSIHICAIFKCLSILLSTKKKIKLDSYRLTCFRLKDQRRKKELEKNSQMRSIPSQIANSSAFFDSCVRTHDHRTNEENGEMYMCAERHLFVVIHCFFRIFGWNHVLTRTHA